ncbi:uncharacterized protein PpBr36_09601 [Pyricularia pennisetigena]|uniref:uncharacterized protein n=1 Tax=Pyricularia pennisetigena TaxID=1578925 RepID=UPI00114F5C52|nr:uncharacterized protein PpBr36_09601 [Pyricularia pennisetigena]TLS21965.1 hypothetical protein PpBr36_09601 [Pyricularia pennisetigena]
MDDYDGAMDRHTPQASSTLDQVARYILADSGSPPGIIVLAGAGISTSAGIPDFRSPKTGLYDNLARFNLDSPTDVFDIDFFRTNPQPFYSLAPELYPGRYAPTISHAFVALLARKGLLAMLFTQNIDGLEKAAGVPPELVVEAHGSFDSQRCVDCAQEFPASDMRAHVAASRVPRCGQCGGLVKPDIVFFGERLPDRFFREREAHLPDLEDEPIPDALWGPRARQVIIVMGTSLRVPPFCELPVRAADGVPRVLFNREVVGDFGEREEDVIELGDCDSGVRKLAEMLGWGVELEVEWRRVVGNEEAERQLVRAAAAAASYPTLVMDDGMSEERSDMSESASDDEEDLMSDDEDGNHEVNDFSSSSLGAVATPLTLDSTYYNPIQDQMVHISSSLPSGSLPADLSCLVPPVEGHFLGSLDHHDNFLVDPIGTRQAQPTDSSDHNQAMLDTIPLPHVHTGSLSAEGDPTNQNPVHDVRNPDIADPNRASNEVIKSTGPFHLSESRVQAEGSAGPDPMSMFTWHDDPGFWGEWSGPGDP